MINKQNLKKYTDCFIDTLLALAAIATLAAGYIIWFVLPRGTGLHGFSKCLQEGYGEGNWGMALDLPRFMWVDIHNWAAVALLLLIIIHLMLHLKWFAGTTKNIIRGYVLPVWHLTERYITSIVLMILFLFEGLSGFVIWVVLPRGALDYNPMTSDHGRTFWSLQRDVWVDLHAWLAVVIISITLIHLIINWRWIVEVSGSILKGIYKPFQKKGAINVTNQP
jgi:hypothetical protein